MASYDLTPLRQPPPDGHSLGTDFYGIEALLSPEDRMFRDKVRAFFDK
jgi:hypothetical protein